MDGILLVDKPKGWTSFDVVAKIRGILARHQSSVISNKSKTQMTDDRRQKTPSPKAKVKVGHTGTLDPMATGLLVLLIGSYTKKAPELTKLDKTYEVTMKLGFTSSTGDSEGTVTPTENCSYKTLSRKIEAKLTEVMGSFVGEGLQVPPAYSAIKVNGQRAYKLARQGKEVKLESRKITVYRLEVTGYSYLEVKFTAKVSSGTYIRSLVEDIGKKLSTGAYMSGLRRTKVGEFDIKDAVNPTDVNPKNIEQNISQTL